MSEVVDTNLLLAPDRLFREPRDSLTTSQKRANRLARAAAAKLLGSAYDHETRLRAIW